MENIGYFLINKSFYNDIYIHDSWEDYINNCILKKYVYLYMMEYDYCKYKRRT